MEAHKDRSEVGKLVCFIWMACPWLGLPRAKQEHSRPAQLLHHGTEVSIEKGAKVLGTEALAELHVGTVRLCEDTDPGTSAPHPPLPKKLPRMFKDTLKKPSPPRDSSTNGYQPLAKSKAVTKSSLAGAMNRAQS